MRKQRYRAARVELEEVAERKTEFGARKIDTIAYNQLLKALLSAKREKKARAWCSEEARKTMSNNKLYRHYIDLHMAAFDHNWKGDRGSRLSALKMYAAAVMAAIA